MPNQSGKAYSLVTLCPIEPASVGNHTSVFNTRKVLQDLPTGTSSPLARVPNTYLARFFILDDIIFQSYPHHLDGLKSKYLVFTANIYLERDLPNYLTEMYHRAKNEIHLIWQHCVGFKKVVDAKSFAEYIKDCQVTTTFFFNGSTDDPLDEQLKSLYIKQEFSKFVFSHQGLPASAVLSDFQKFCQIHKPTGPQPTWPPGLEQ